MSQPPGRLHQLIPLIGVQAVGVACGLAGVRWSSVLVPPETLGTYSLLVSAHTVAAFATHQGLVQHVQRHWTRETEGGAYLRVLWAALPRPTLWLLAALAGVIVFFQIGATGNVGWSWWFWLAVVNLLTLSAHLTQTALQAEQRYWVHFIVSAVASVTRTFLPLAFVIWSSATLAKLGTGFLLHSVAWAMAGAVALRPAWGRNAPQMVGESPQRMLVAFLGVGVCGWFALNSPRWVAALALDETTTGHFMLAANLSSIISAGISLVGVGYTFPELFAAGRSGADGRTLLNAANRHVAWALAGGQAAVGALAWIGPRLVGVLVDARYAAAMDWVFASGGAALATVSAAFYCNVLVALRRERACFHLLLWSTAARLIVMAALAWADGGAWFRIGLACLAWPTAVLEWWLVRRESERSCSRAA